MATKEQFDAAVEASRGLPKTLTNQDLLDLYSLYKQATSGDASGKRPGMFDPKGRAKYDAWARQKGKSSDDARAAYVALVGKLGS